MWITRATTVLVVLAVLGSPTMVVAHDHQPPRTLLVVGSVTQPGLNYYSAWHSRSDEGCVGQVADGPELFPPAVGVHPGFNSFAVRLRKADRPKDVRITAWRLESPLGGGLGPSDEVSFVLQPVRRGGKVVAFDALFDAAVIGHYYVRVLAAWRDSQGCGGLQEAGWTFHVSSI